MEIDSKQKVSQEILLKAFNHMMVAKATADVYEENRNICKYVHSTSRGHEAIQLATAYQLTKEDWVSPYYRDESMLLGMGFEPYQLMLQLLAKAEVANKEINKRLRSFFILKPPGQSRVFLLVLMFPDWLP